MTAMKPWKSALLVAAGVIVLSLIAIEPPARKASSLADNKKGADVVSQVLTPEEQAAVEGNGGAATSQGAGGKAGAVAAAQSQKKAKAAGSLVCKSGQNGGATDKGVTGGRIKLASTNVRSGTGSSFLGSSYVGMQAVVNRTNAKGGVCGRLLDLRIVDDGWEAARGATYIENFVKADYFALPVVPSSEGLTVAIDNGTISGAKIPVVGTDGMLKAQYFDPYVWPVAASTITTMRVMAKYAWDTGSRSFGIVFDARYKFGVEGAAAFSDYVKTLTGNAPKAYIGIEPGKGSYASDAQAFNDACNPACDFVAMLLTPETANTYINSQQPDGERKKGFGKMLTGGAQPLFNERFARDCGKYCDSMLVWTGYNPPVGRLASEPAVAAYVDDVHSVDPGVDVNNQFLEGAYLGMKVFVTAVEKVGPNLTRAGLRDVMNSLTYQSDLVSSLTWGPQVPQQRFANLSAQAFKIVTASGSFVGFAEANTGFLRDPTPGVVPK
jgi:ABC-type branched-subunit amino acid transport system substrate-binding protein